ncbi:Reverse transcriptase-RNase H-integrase [Mycena kentingensis (nom. inval.)]|nr:Reverse transcriptase-RNase H-integrase [Mycena kentingensis (nom. inval.)]
MLLKFPSTPWNGSSQLDSALPPSLVLSCPKALLEADRPNDKLLVSTTALPTPISDPSPSPNLPTSAQTSISSLTLHALLMRTSNENIPPTAACYPPTFKDGEGYIIVTGPKSVPQFVGGKIVPSTLDSFKRVTRDYADANGLKKDKDIISKLVLAFHGKAIDWADENAGLENLTLEEFFEKVRGFFSDKSWKEDTQNEIISMRMDDFPTARAYLDAVAAKRRTLKGTDMDLSSAELISIGSRGITRSLAKILEKKEHKSDLASKKTFLEWSEYVTDVDKVERDAEQKLQDSINARVAAGIAAGLGANSSTAASSLKRSLNSSDASKKPRDSTFVAAAGNATFAAPAKFVPEPFVLPAALFQGPGTYAGQKRVAKLVEEPFNERGNLASGRTQTPTSARFGSSGTTTTRTRLPVVRPLPPPTSLAPGAAPNNARAAAAPRAPAVPPPLAPIAAAVGVAMNHGEDDYESEGESDDDIAARNVSDRNTAAPPYPTSPSLPSAPPVSPAPCPATRVAVVETHTAAAHSRPRQEPRIAELVGRHLVWECLTDSPSEPNVPVRALIDDGSGLDLIDPSFVDQHGLKTYKLYQPISFGLALDSTSPRPVCTHYVKLRLHSADSVYSTRTFLGRQEGPYTITAIHPECSTVTLDLRNQPRVYPVFHVSELVPYHENDPSLFPDRELTRLDPVVGPDGEEEYLIEKVLDKRTRYGKTQYKIRWRGYGPEDDDWIDGDELEDSAHVEAFDAGLPQDNIALQPITEDPTPQNFDEPVFAHIEPISRPSSPSPNPPLAVVVAGRQLRPRGTDGRALLPSSSSRGTR